MEDCRISIRYLIVMSVVFFLPLNLHAKTISGQLFVHEKQIDFMELHKGLFTIDGRPSTKTIKVIHTAAEYKNSLAVYSRDPIKEVDFSKGSVLLLDIGSRNTGGYSVMVSAVVEQKDHVVVKVKLVNPLSDCMLIQAFTNPYQFTYIKSHKNMVIVEEMVYSGC